MDFDKHKALQDAIHSTPRPICYHCNKQNEFMDGVFFEAVAEESHKVMLYRCRFCRDYFAWNYTNLTANKIDKAQLHYLMQKHARGELTKWY